MLSIVKKKEKEKRDDIISHIYEEYYLWLIKRARAKIKDESACEDLFNDCVIGWIRNTHTLERLSESELRAYVLKSMDYACINYLKRTSKAPEPLEDDEGNTIDIEDETQNVEEITDKKYNYETIERAVLQLSEREKNIIYMKYKLEMKDRDIAPILEIKEDSVRMTVRRCVKKLEIIMKKEMG